jgi:hypothetical protein
MCRRAVLGGELLEGASLTETGSGTLSSFLRLIRILLCGALELAVQFVNALLLSSYSRQPIAYALAGRVSRQHCWSLFEGV